MAVDRKLVAARAREAGWEVDTSTKGELRLVPPDGQAVVLATDKVRQKGRKVTNDLATLRRLGLATDDVHTTRECEHSWHDDGIPGRFCPHCRGTWRRDPQEVALKRNMVNPPQREKLECPYCPEWFWVTQRGTFDQHVANHEEEAAAAAVVAAPEPDPAPPPKEEPVVAAPQPIRPEPTTAAPPGVETICYEVATIDGKGRLVLRDDKGELYVAVPLLPAV